MAWTLKMTNEAEKSLNHIDRKSANRIRKTLNDIIKLDDPRLKGKALTGNLSGLWSYRIGEYRALCQIKDKELIVLVVRIAHRNKSYK